MKKEQFDKAIEINNKIDTINYYATEFRQIVAEMHYLTPQEQEEILKNYEKITSAKINRLQEEFDKL